MSSSVISPRVRTLVDLLRPITDRFTYTARCGVSAGLKRRGGLGFLPRAQTSEEIFVQNMNVSDKVVYDIGAYEGLFTIRFASRAKHVYTFEPHPWCQRQTSINVAANGFHNVSLLPVALGSDSSLAFCRTRRMNPRERRSIRTFRLCSRRDGAISRARA